MSSTAVIAGVFITALGWTLMRLIDVPTKVPHDRDIVIDDFGFAATAARPAGMSAGDQLYEVRMRVRNRALRVDYTFKPGDVYASTESGKPLRYVACRGGSAVLRPHEERSFVLLFKGPAGAKKLTMAVKPGGWVGDMLEAVVFGRKEQDVEVVASAWGDGLIGSA